MCVEDCVCADSCLFSREGILKTAKALVEDTKVLVQNATASQEKLAQAAQSSVSTITRLAEVVKLGAASLGSEDPETQVGCQIQGKQRLLVTGLKELRIKGGVWCSGLDSVMERAGWALSCAEYCAYVYTAYPGVPQFLIDGLHQPQPECDCSKLFLSCSLQVVLINAVKDVAKALGDLIGATKAAAGKAGDDPAVYQLKNSAKV